jgi:hypothetical protein
MDRRAELQQDIAFADGLLPRDGYDLTLRAALMIAKRQLEEELSNLDTQAADWKRDRD